MRPAREAPQGLQPSAGVSWNAGTSRGLSAMVLRVQYYSLHGIQQFLDDEAPPLHDSISQVGGRACALNRIDQGIHLTLRRYHASDQEFFPGPKSEFALPDGDGRKGRLPGEFFDRGNERSAEIFVPDVGF